MSVCGVDFDKKIVAPVLNDRSKSGPEEFDIY
jgi:hypothetical protein